MTPTIRKIVDDALIEHEVSLERVIGKDRSWSAVRARIKIARMMYARGYTNADICRVIHKAHDMVSFYLGNRKTKKPVIQELYPPCEAHNNFRCKRCDAAQVVCDDPPLAPRPVPARIRKQRRKYLQPYAGADFTQYQWVERK